MYLILHTFSRRNSGDGLLVDLTLEALKDAGIAADECALLALDPESFDNPIRVYRAPGEPFGRPSPRLARAALEVLVDGVTAGHLGTVGKLARHAKGLIAVGGGYLVADSFVRQSGVLFNHMAQLSAAARSEVPTIYLPQSIGPATGLVGTMMRKRLAAVDRLYVRDDKTFSELGFNNMRRVGDLAVMKLARKIHDITPENPSGKPVLVARDLPSAGEYQGRLTQLVKGLHEPIYAVQADAPGPRSDAAFYRRMGWTDDGSFQKILRSGAPGVVVSVRLHGAIAALLAGWPAIHLSYERKGWGAYEDLGVAEYVHDARTFDPDLILAQVKQLSEDPMQYWDRIRSSADVLKTQYAGMVDDLKKRLNP
ncbi:Polysaccharide pyruvyl transferase family protein WcaK [Ruegeria halocynthiae]|uniref:Polysaccharide pyruvyl transferase family protein WcaK n=1 Tax=Ruegeria halocynthiae TaxID=985054 RepID=A0A1H3EMS8_9RHOB|nr:polysaccharide pyruvyl transferase family protein [Ruegeria halocynthiae]SDX79264.1 Polysaccharide pyruvyl transferase family protein WcaK [Ruegeria halocynthiae]